MLRPQSFLTPKDQSTLHCSKHDPRVLLPSPVFTRNVLCRGEFEFPVVPQSRDSFGIAVRGSGGTKRLLQMDYGWRNPEGTLWLASGLTTIHSPHMSIGRFAVPMCAHLRAWMTCHRALANHQ